MLHIKGLITAIRTLSIFTVPGRDSDKISSALPWFPVVGAALGLLLHVISLWLIFVFNGKFQEITALIVLISSVIITRGLHLDGLADWSDAFWGARDKEKILAIMKDTHIGTFGTLALITILLAKWIAFSLLSSQRATIWIVSAYIVSRTVQVDLAVRLPYARDKGGTGGPFVETASIIHMIIAIITALLLVLILHGAIGVIPIIIALAVSNSFGFWCYRRIGGVTGDVLGACSEITETLVLLSSVIITM